MSHEIHRVTDFENVAPFTLRVEFEDGTSQVIDFSPVIHGELYGPLQDQAFFRQGANRSGGSYSRLAERCRF